MLVKLLIGALLLCSFAEAAEIERMGSMTCKIKSEQTHVYFTLSDGSCWQVFPFTKRWRSPLEWWRGVNLEVPDGYECLPDDWVVGAEIEAYPKYDALSVDETNASNAEQLKRCTHLLVNRHTRQILFALALPPGECLKQVFEEAYQQGFAKGKSSGYHDGYYAGRHQSHSEPSIVYVPLPPSAPPMAYAEAWPVE